MNSYANAWGRRIESGRKRGNLILQSATSQADIYSMLENMVRGFIQCSDL